MDMVRYISLLLFIGLAFLGCTGSHPSDFPNWIDPYLLSPNKFVGIGNAKRPNFSLSKAIATQRARLDIVQKVDNTIGKLKYYRSADIGASNLKESFEIFREEVASKVGIHSIVEKTEITHDSTVYVMVTLSFNEANEILHNTFIKVFKSKYDEQERFKESKAFRTFYEDVQHIKLESYVE